jgi:hypothetical protein
MTSETASPQDEIMEPRLWKRNGWTARVRKNEDDDGWAVEMVRDGDSEPVLTAPWTMGRDKKNPKPLDQSAFITWVKTASEVLLRHQQQLKAQLHRSTSVTGPDGRAVRVDFDVVPDEDDPRAVLSAWDPEGNQLASYTVPPDFKISSAIAARWVSGGMKEPRP